MTSDVISDSDYQQPTDEELHQLMFYNDIIDTEREAAALEAAEHEMRWGTIIRSQCMD